MRYAFVLLFSLIVMGCGNGSDNSEVKVKGLTAALRPPARQGLKSVKVLNVPELAMLEVTADALGRAQAEGNCVELPEIPVSLAASQAPSLAFETFDAKSTVSFVAHGDFSRPLIEVPQADFKEMALGKSGLSELALSQSPSSAKVIQVVTRSGEKTQIEGCLLVKTHVAMATPVYSVVSAPRGLDLTGMPMRTYDAADINITNPNNAPMTVTFAASLEDTTGGKAFQICHRLDPDPTGTCTPYASFTVSVGAKSQMTVGIKGGFFPEPYPQGRFRTVSLKVIWSFSARIEGAPTFASPMQSFMLQ